MTARNETYALMQHLGARGISLSFDEANTLRRAQLTLHRWAELECGDGNDYASWSIERDEATGKPFFCRYPHDGKMYRTRIADREAGALKRVKAICGAHGLHFYHQTDPRGCALYVSNEPLLDHNYTRGVACCA
jgi:hypothetical protein